MTSKQRIKFFAELWPDACHGQGWQEEDRDLRLRVVSEAIGREVESVNDVNRTNEFDLLKARLLTLADSLAGAIEDGDGEPGRRRRYLWLIRNKLRPPQAYLSKILRDRFKVDSAEELGASELHQLVATLTARTNKLRRRSAQPEAAECPF